MNDWQAARSHPHTYPGTHPDGDFALIDDTVQDLIWDDPSRLGSLRPGGDSPSPSLASLLADRGLAALEDRIPVLAYGGNRSPATLALKLRHYSYISPGQGLVLPVLTARLRGFDVVAGGLSGQGYLYADLYSDDTTMGTELAVHVLLLDPDQLRVMHDSEGVRTGLYDVASIDGLMLDGQPRAAAVFSSMSYVGVGPVVVSPLAGSPLAFSAVRASGRVFPEFDTVAMLAHALQSIDLLPQVRTVVGAGLDELGGGELIDPLALAAELMRYLNGQWWYRQHTRTRRLLACERLESLIDERLLASSRPNPARDDLKAQGRILTADEAYFPRPHHTLGGAGLV